jgi:hypothetical protein
MTWTPEQPDWKSDGDLPALFNEADLHAYVMGAVIVKEHPQVNATVIIVPELALQNNEVDELWVGIRKTVRDNAREAMTVDKRRGPRPGQGKPKPCVCGHVKSAHRGSGKYKLGCGNMACACEKYEEAETETPCLSDRSDPHTSREKE